MVEEFIIKKADIADIKDIFELSNDSEVRNNSFNNKEIPWKIHQSWFSEKINSPECLFFVIKDKSKNLIAQVRFDYTNPTEGAISYSVAKNFRNQGYGVKILKLVSEKIVSEFKVQVIIAYIKSENLISKKTFEKAGYNFKEESQKKAKYEFKL